MKPVNAVELSPSADLHQVSLEDAALLLPAAHIFVLTVSPAALLEAKQILKELCCTVKDNIFSPYVNLVVDEEYRADEWSLAAGPRIVWSR